MRPGFLSFAGICTIVLVFCAVLSTTLVVHQAIAPPNSNSSLDREVWQATYEENWRAAFNSGTRAGPRSAPVKIVYFEDFQCPHCADFELVVQTIRRRFTDEVEFAFVSIPLPYHEFAIAAHRVVECAKDQGRYDEMRSLLFKKQQAFGSLGWAEFAVQAGVEDVGLFQVCVDAPPVADVLAQNKKIAEELGVRGTPTIVVNGWKLPGTPSLEIMDVVVRNSMAGKTPIDGVDFFALATISREESVPFVSIPAEPERNR